MKIVVTGAVSMVGLATIQAALDDDAEKIFAVIRRGSSNNSRLPKDRRIIPVQCSMDEYDSLADMIGQKCDCFFHFAWEPSMKPHSQRYFDVEVGYRNQGYALMALEAAAKLGCHNFVGAGSQAEYGNLRGETQKPEDLTDPVTSYGIAKDQTRRMLMLKSGENGVNVQWVRIFSLYGIHDRKNTLISTLIEKMGRNEEIELTDGTQMWDYLYEEDAGKALYAVGCDSRESGIFCLGSGDAKPLREYIFEMKQIIGSDSVLKFGAVQYGKDAVMNVHADISKIERMTRWNGPVVGFEEGIRRILEHNAQGQP